ncbi:zinc transporter ZIP9 isoform X1 [Anastrepha ludens]|uniref:zinc transporter ZIP9 isoform X1 n=2 Tax=Anastrepha ludens TaxID=28586 RepID=UPI0023AFCFE2|nr:zinc transporter ZIP9 isoform X1 [Anastrepha ludens]XP_053969107.1 zinc transporter ZIP9 isoform X1 [Anastrepha ludens]
MTEETAMLVLLVAVMLVGSYMAGMIPLVMKLSEEKLKFVTVLGAGLLVGTALTVIIPEGVRSMYIDPKKNSLPETTTTGDLQFEKSVIPSTTDHLHNGYRAEPEFSRTIGLSLVLGFVFMMLVDQISQHKSVNNVNDKNITATLGLVVHAAADGVALGAAATTSHQDVEIIVFLAIMLHKAPAAFGLVSFLLHEKIERQQIRKHLLIFSLSAPLLTLLTYFGIGQEQKETLNTLNATGIAMLFSAGTFLYVATVHVLPELTQSSGDNRLHLHEQYGYRLLDSALNEIESQVDLRSSNGNTTRASSKGMRISELIILICGALLPLVITFGHQHS